MSWSMVQALELLMEEPHGKDGKSSKDEDGETQNGPKRDAAVVKRGIKQDVAKRDGANTNRRGNKVERKGYLEG